VKESNNRASARTARAGVCELRCIIAMQAIPRVAHALRGLGDSA
jgi:hypothetical protein